MLDFKVVEVNFRISSIPSEITSKSFFKIEDNDSGFLLMFTCQVNEKHNANSFLEIKSQSDFQILDVNDPDVIKNYKVSSAPAIVFPFIRAFVANFTLQSMNRAIVLPTYNFFPLNK